jgi:D-sedoheptulose 7-phosphate isomerase
MMSLIDTLARIDLSDLDYVVAEVKAARSAGSRVFFIGNGGSAGIASHMAADWTKNGNFSALALNDPCALTCISNDIGYDDVFVQQLIRHGRKGDVLFAISSSGMSENIIRAAKWAVAEALFVVTLSGFRKDNNLRGVGHVNFYVPSDAYGMVEISHLSICHAVLDKVINAN